MNDLAHPLKDSKCRLHPVCCNSNSCYEIFHITSPPGHISGLVGLYLVDGCVCSHLRIPMLSPSPLLRATRTYKSYTGVCIWYCREIWWRRKYTFKHNKLKSYYQSTLPHIKLKNYLHDTTRTIKRTVQTWVFLQILFVYTKWYGFNLLSLFTEGDPFHQLVKL